MGDPLGVEDQQEPLQLDPQTGPQVARFGELKGTWVVLRSKIDAVETEPTQHLELVLETRHERMRFAVVVPATLTGYTAHVGRWIQAKGKGVTVDQWVEEQTVSKTTSFIFDIEIGRDKVGIYIDNFSGDPDEAVHILYQPTNSKPT